jgi:predicted CXXCH cytochrome family protein
MKRFVVFISLFALLTLSVAWLANAAAVSVKNSKHNLQYKAVPESGTGTIKASVDKDMGGTSEICVFCHTPHSGNTQAPLWNKSASVGSYSTYTSDVLAGLGYWPAEDPKNGVPHAKTRICLSCHDGTIALGSLVNLPHGVSMQIPMEGTTGGDVQYGMPRAAAGYIGVELKDDHPVAIKHDNGKDSELKAAISAGSNVNLYYEDGVIARKTKNGLEPGAGYVECTSCHDPHDNQYGKFLVETNQMSALCLECHDKTKFPNSIHNTSSVGYSPLTGGTPPYDYLGNGVSGTVGDVKCMNCHFPHKSSGSGTPGNFSANANAEFGKYLLSFQEEKSCYNSPDRWGQTTTPCHGNNAQAATNIADLVAPAKPSRHNVELNNTSSLHKATEAQAAGWLDPTNTNWHVECADCHNPHTAGNTSHTTRPPVPVTGAVQPPVLTNASSLYGTGGVQVTVAPAWPNGQGTYNYLEPIGVVDYSKLATGVSYEYQICLKCHSEYAWRNSTAPNSPSFSPPAAMTDQAREFMNTGVGNSFHPVAAVTGRNVGTLVTAPVNWQANRGNQTMYCSDCHNNSAAPPQGPHGSSQNFILFGTYDDVLGTAGGAQQNAGDMCMTCHDPATYVTASLTGPVGTGFLTTGGLNLHASHAYRAIPANPRPNGSGVTTPISYKCVDCHVRVPHGWGVAGRRAMVIVNNEGATYGAQYEAGGAGAGLISAPFNQPGTPGTYGVGMGANCTTAANCHHL